MELKIGKADFENYFREKGKSKRDKKGELLEEMPKKTPDKATKSFDGWTKDEEDEKGKNIDIYV